jgi:PAP2 superfamily
LLDAALQFAYASGMRFKHALCCPRPSEYSAMVQPIIEVPQHASLPSGHATEAHVTAGILSELVPGAKEGKLTDKYLRRLAFRIARNREISGVHFPVDTLAGRLLGDSLASYFLAMCGRSEGKWTGGHFDVSGLDLNLANDEAGEDDLRWEGARCCKKLSGQPQPLKSGDGTDVLALTRTLRQMWVAAADEWGPPK